MQFPEFLSDLLFIGSVGGHPHEPSDLDIRPFALSAALHYLLQQRLFHSRFGGLLGNADLEQNSNDPIILPGALIDLPEQFDAVHTVYQVDEGCNEFHLIGLQMPDHVPANVRRHLRLFLEQLLNLVLAKIALTRRIGR